MKINYQEVKRQISKVLTFTLVCVQIAGNAVPTYAEVVNRNEEYLASASNAIQDSKVTGITKEQQDVELMVSSDMSRYDSGDMLCLDVYVKNNTSEEITDSVLKFSGKGISKDTSYFEIDENIELLPGLTEGGGSSNLDFDYISEDGRLEGMVLAPKSIYHVYFYCEIDSDIEGVKDRSISFTLSGKKDGKKVTTKDDFYYTIGGMNLNKIEISDEVYAEDDDNSFELSYDLGSHFEESIEEKEMERLSQEEDETVKESEQEVSTEETKADIESVVSDEVEDIETTDSEDNIKETDIIVDNTEFDTDKVEESTEEPIQDRVEDRTEEDGLEEEPKIDVLASVLSYMDSEVSEEETDSAEVESVEESSTEETEVKEEETESSEIESVEESSTEGIEVKEEETDSSEIESVEESSTEETETKEETEVSTNKDATHSNADPYVKWEDEELKDDEKPLVRNIKATMEAYGFELTDIETSSLGDAAIRVDYSISDNVTTGVYFGKIITTYSYKNKNYHTSQGFMLHINGEEIVNPNEEITLITDFNGAEVVVTGPRSSFPDGDELELSVTEIDTEKSELVTEALDKKSEELDMTVGSMKALDIKVLADGEYKELQGDVNVEFRALTLDAMYKTVDISEDDLFEMTSLETEDNFEGEESDSLDFIEAETEVTSQTEVLHLDEDDLELNNMGAVLTDDGSLSMETNHFSIFIVVNFEAKEVPLHIQHYADVVRPLVMEADNEDKALGINWKLDNGLVSDNGLWAGFGAISVTDDGDSIYKTEYTKIYSDDYFKLPGWTTKGMPFSTILRKLCKLLVEYNGDSEQNHYKADKVTFKNDTRELECIINEDGTYTCNWIKGETEVIEGVNGYTDNDVMIPLDKSNNEIVIHYVNTLGEVYVDTNFHDYSATVQNVDDCDIAEDTISFTKGGTQQVKLSRRLNTKYVGINNSEKLTVEYENGEVKELYPPKDVSKRLLIGGESLSLYNYENARLKSKTRPCNINSGNITPNIVQDRLDEEGNLIYKEGLFAPLLFAKGNIYTEETYRLRKTDEPEKVKYLANQYLPGYKLGFKRYGDFHVITSCVNPSGVTVLSNLHRMKHVGANWNNTRQLYSNLFWPLDEVVIEKGDNGAAKINDRLMPHIGFTANDDSRVWWKAKFENGVRYPIYRVANYNNASEWTKYNAIAARNEFHNWFFGMDFEVEFDVSNYIGPLDFYFKGDDDLFVFIDGIKICDLGGIHSSIGSYLDLKQIMKEKGLVREDTVTQQLIPIDEDGNDMVGHKFTLKVFYTERGGTGSTCYMTYTLPKVTEPEFEKYDNHKLYLHKHWLDEGDTNNNRPSSITVQLYQDGEPFGDEMELNYDEMELNGEDEWVYTWNHLPDGHVYTVKEVNVDSNYVGSVGIPNTVEDEEAATELDMVNIEATQVSTKKNFSNTLEKRDVYVALYQVDEIDTEPTLVNDSVRLLNKDNNWEMTWDNLPKYAYSKEGHDKFEAFEITYLPYEVEATGVTYTDIIDNDLIDVDTYAITTRYDDGDVTLDGKYLVTYDTRHTVINNERVTDIKEFTVIKDWVDDGVSTRPYWIQVNLYQDGKPYKQVYLSEDNNYTYTWKVPVNKADDTEYVYTLAECYDNKDLSDGDIVKFNTKDEYQVGYTKVSEDTVKITNTYIPPKTKELEVIKYWENTDKVEHPDSVIINIYQNGVFYKQDILNSKNNFDVKVEVPLMDEYGSEYVYTVLESVNGKDITEGETVYLTDMDKYRVTYIVNDNTYSIINTYIEPKMKVINVNKVWVDETTSTRPYWIEVHLYQDGKLYKAVYLNQDNGYKYTWQVPAERKDGTSYEYEVYEVFDNKDLLDGSVAKFNDKDEYKVSYESNELFESEIIKSNDKNEYKIFYGLGDTDITITNTYVKPDEPSTEEPSTEEPSTGETSTEETSTEELSTEEPSTEEPSTKEPSTEETSTEEPSTEETSTEEPSTEETSTEEPSKPYRGGGGGGSNEPPKETTPVVEETHTTPEKPPVKEIDDERVPLGKFKPEEIMTDSIKSNLVLLLEGDVPLYGFMESLPKTGDTSHTGFWAILFGISSIGLGLFGLSEYKRRKKNKDL